LAVFFHFNPIWSNLDHKLMVTCSRLKLQGNL
jgi:hypothetical protein